MPRPRFLREKYEALQKFPSVQTWLNNPSSSQHTRKGALYYLQRWTNHTGKNPEQLLAEKEAELRKERRLRYQTEDMIKAWAKSTPGAYVYSALVKSFFAGTISRWTLSSQGLRQPESQSLFRRTPSRRNWSWARAPCS